MYFDKYFFVRPKTLYTIIHILDFNMSLLEQCIIFATKKHFGQIDKAGLPYILHPLRVMLDPTLDTEEKRCVAILHDTLEDTNTTRDELFYLTNDRIENSVYYLTHEKNIPNIQYWNKILEDPTGIARIVKLVDIQDNLSPTRLSVLSKTDQIRLCMKYAKAISILDQKV